MRCPLFLCFTVLAGRLMAVPPLPGHAMSDPVAQGSLEGEFEIESVHVSDLPSQALSNRALPLDTHLRPQGYSE